MKMVMDRIGFPVRGMGHAAEGGNAAASRREECS